MKAMATSTPDRVKNVDLVSLRHDLGLTIEQAASLIGIGKHVLGDAELGARPQPRHALAIAEFYGKRVTALWPVRAT